MKSKVRGLDRRYASTIKLETKKEFGLGKYSKRAGVSVRVNPEVKVIARRKVGFIELMQASKNPLGFLIKNKTHVRALFPKQQVKLLVKEALQRKNPNYSSTKEFQDAMKALGFN